MSDDKYKLVKPEEFKSAVDSVREKGELYKANVHPYSVDEYKDMRTYLSADGKSGYAIKPDGELVSVHSGVKGRGDDLVRDAVKKGAKKLDAYDIKGKLPELYGKHGFKEKGRYPFDPQYAEDLDILKKERPDFVEMERKGETARQLDARRQALANKARRMKLEGRLTPEMEKMIVSKNDQIKEAIGKRALQEREAPQVIKNVTDKIKTKETKRLLTGPEHMAKIAALKKFGKRGLKALPLVGPAIAAMASQDVSAAVPVLSEADPLGPQAGSLEAAVEDPSLSREQRMKAIEQLMQKNKGEQ